MIDDFGIRSGAVKNACFDWERKTKPGRVPDNDMLLPGSQEVLFLVKGSFAGDLLNAAVYPEADQRSLSQALNAAYEARGIASGRNAPDKIAPGKLYACWAAPRGRLDAHFRDPTSDLPHPVAWIEVPQAARRAIMLAAAAGRDEESSQAWFEALTAGLVERENALPTSSGDKQMDDLMNKAGLHYTGATAGHNLVFSHWMAAVGGAGNTTDARGTGTYYLYEPSADTELSTISTTYEAIEHRLSATGGAEYFK